MKVFISWSGERSKLVAELLDEWIQCVIQAVDPWLSSKDIDRGSLWFSEISNQLSDTKVGIVCLTKQNKEKPWILFESGALAKGLSSNRVCTFLIDLDPSDIGNPLAQFNHTLPTKESIWELIRTINLLLDDNRLKESLLEKVFETYYPQFENRFEEILEITPETESKVKRKGDEIMLEVLSSVRMLERRLRSIEYDQSKTLNFDKAARYSSESYLYKLIERYVNSGLSAEKIRGMISDKNVPLDHINLILESILSKHQESGSGSGSDLYP